MTEEFNVLRAEIVRLEHEVERLTEWKATHCREYDRLTKLIGAETLRHGEDSIVSKMYEHERIIHQGRSILIAIRVAAIGGLFLAVAGTSGIASAFLKIFGLSK